MADLEAIIGGTGTGPIRGEKGAPNVHKKTEMVEHSYVPGYTMHPAVDYGHHMPGHGYGHGCVPAPAPVHAPVVKKGVAPELVLFILLVIVIRCYHY